MRCSNHGRLRRQVRFLKRQFLQEGEFEPRNKKRRFKLYNFVEKPRHEAKLDILKGTRDKLSAIRVSRRCSQLTLIPS